MKNAFFLSLLFIANLIFAQDAILEDGKLPEAELHVAINPTNPNNIVVATHHGFESDDEDAFNLRIYYTSDFGENWNTSDFRGSYDGPNPAGDPVLSFDKEGNVFLVNLVIDSESFDVNTLLSKSSDGGDTWSLVSTVATMNTDKPWLTIDKSDTSPYKGNIYIPLVENNLNLYTLDDNYQTTNSITIPDGDQLPSVVVRNDGTVFTSTVYIDISGGGDGLKNIIYVQEYSNGGSNLVHSTKVVDFPDYTFNVPDISKRFQPTSYLSIDNSGGVYDGRLYLSYTASEENNPDYFNVFITYSDDNGVTWSTPKVVHTNPQDEVQQFYSSSYVNNKGVLIVDWYDRKNYTNTNKLTDFFIGISHDGGNTFTETQLNSASSDFDFVVSSSGDFGIGEYHQVVATDDKAISFWSDGRTNDEDLNIYFAKVDLNDPLSVEEFGLVSNNYSVSPLYPLPADNIVYSNVKFKETSDMKYEIFNSVGKKIKDGIWEQYRTGEHRVAINIDYFSTGTYFVKFITRRGYFKTQKLIKK